MSESKADMPEIRDIPGFEGRYAVSIDGRIWSHPKSGARNPARNHSGRWIGQRLNHKGYLRATFMTTDGKQVTTPIHRLVALAFVPNPFGLPQVNHVNGNKTDNSAANLQWCNARQNIQHALKSGLINTRTPAKMASCRRNLLKANKKRREMHRER